jgi:hypothetical protein
VDAGCLAETQTPVGHPAKPSVVYANLPDLSTKTPLSP